MDISELELLVKEYPILFGCAAAFIGYTTICSVLAYLEKRKRIKLEEECRNLKEELKEKLLSYEDLLREHARLLKNPRIRKMYRKGAKLPNDN